MDNLNNFFEEIKGLYIQNEFLKNKINDLTNENEKYITEIDNLKILLEKKPSIKPSVSLWENSQNLIYEKDKEIEYLKKQLKFYERKNSKLTDFQNENNEQIIEKDSDNKEAVNKESVNKESVNKECVNKESVNKESVNKESVKKDKSKKKKKKLIVEDDEDLERELGLL